MPHEVHRTIVEVAEYQDHVKRTTSALFRENRQHLIEAGYGCWICGSKDRLEAHHVVEWALWNSLDPIKVTKVLWLFNFYDQPFDPANPLTSPDDIRNLVLLCEPHHRGADLGIHELTFPIWLAQACTKDGLFVTKQTVTEVQKLYSPHDSSHV